MSKVSIAMLFSLSLFITNAYSQMPGGSTTPPDFNAAKAAGIIIYDFDDVVNKLKVKDEGDQKKIAEALKIYNTKIDKLSFTHAFTFKELEDEFDRNVKIAMQNRDRSQMNGVRAKIQETIPPIKKVVTAEEEQLNEAMAKILTEKQNGKWLKYQKRKKG